MSSIWRGIAVSACVLAAAALAYLKVDGWGAFLFIAFLVLL